VAHPARVYNVWLGGRDHYAADRDAADEVIRHRPQVVAGARANRHFLARVVRFLAAECGIRQFIDIGTGLPAPDNTHEVAQRITPASRIVYVDNDRCNLGCSHIGNIRTLRQSPHAAHVLVRVCARGGHGRRKAIRAVQALLLDTY
jgi:hypothetical protein